MEDAHKRGIIQTVDIDKHFTAFFSEDRPEEAWFFERRAHVFETVTDSNERMAFLRATVINKLVDCVSKVFIENYDAIMAGTFKGSLIAHLPQHEQDALEECRSFSVPHIYKHPSVVKIEVTGYNIIGSLMNEFMDAILHPDSGYHKRLISIIPDQFKTEKDDPYSKIQVVLDYISNMTDLYAVQLYKDLRGIE